MNPLLERPVVKTGSLRQWKRERQTDSKRAIKRGRFRAELFAKLASYPSLDSVTKRERQQFLGLVRKTGFSFAGARAPRRPEGDESRWTVLRYVHAIVRPFLTRLLDGQPVPLQSLAARERTSASLTPYGRVLFHTGEEWHQEEMVVELWRLVREGEAFPLRRCAHCKTKIFVKVGRQEYCSASCRNKANDARRNPDERRLYQRQLMRDRRAHGKEPKWPQKKVRPPVVKTRGTSQGNPEKR